MGPLISIVGQTIEHPSHLYTNTKVLSIEGYSIFAISHREPQVHADIDPRHRSFIVIVSLREHACIIWADSACLCAHIPIKSTLSMLHIK